MNSLMLTLWLFVVVWTALAYVCLRVGGRASIRLALPYTIVAFAGAVVITGA